MAEKNILLETVIEAIKSKKGKNITLLDLRELGVFAEYFVLATASSTPQINALIDAVDENASKIGVKGIRPQGDNRSPWVLFDFGDIIVHIFSEEARDFYQLERLWSEGKKSDIADE